MQIHASRRLKDDTTAEVVHWSVHADDYDAGLAKVRAAVPEGWVLLGIRVDR